MQVIFLTFISIIISGSSASAGTCEAVRWPYSSNIKDIQPLSLQVIKRAHLYSYLYHELSTPVASRVPGLVQKLFFYLKNTEANEDKYQMIQAFEWAADLQTKNPRVIPLSEICNIEQKIARTPSSKASVVKKSSKSPNKVKPRAK